MPPFVSRTGVFVDENRLLVERIAAWCSLDVIQLHGNENVEYCRGFSRTLIKAFWMRDAAIGEQLAVYQKVTRTFLLDTYVPGEIGGTGRQFNWEWARRVRGTGRVIIIAGGLTPDNVAEAVVAARPYAVDVSSGVERNGKKDALLMQEFVESVRRLMVTLPDKEGHFGVYGGRYVAETLMPAVLELGAAYAQARRDPAFLDLLSSYFKGLRRPAHALVLRAAVKHEAGRTQDLLKERGS